VCRVYFTEHSDLHDCSSSCCRMDEWEYCRHPSRLAWELGRGRGFGKPFVGLAVVIGTVLEQSRLVIAQTTALSTHSRVV